jgi:hypothetical protein
MSTRPLNDGEIMAFPQKDPLHVFILERFAAVGHSPSPDEIRLRFGLATLTEVEEQVAALERTGAIHRTAGDTSITHAYPFSNEPTAHRVHLVGGPDVFAMCAIDALGMPFMLRRDARIRSSCAECGTVIGIDIEEREIARNAPRDTVVWLGERVDGCVAATDLCPDLNFFCSQTHLAQWRTRVTARGEQLTLDEALARGRQVFERLMESSLRWPE